MSSLCVYVHHLIDNDKMWQSDRFHFSMGLECNASSHARCYYTLVDLLKIMSSNKIKYNSQQQQQLHANPWETDRERDKRMPNWICNFILSVVFFSNRSVRCASLWQFSFVLFNFYVFFSLSPVSSLLSFVFLLLYSLCCAVVYVVFFIRTARSLVAHNAQMLAWTCAYDSAFVFLTLSIL